MQLNNFRGGGRDFFHPAGKFRQGDLGFGNGLGKSGDLLCGGLEIAGFDFVRSDAELSGDLADMCHLRGRVFA